MKSASQYIWGLLGRFSPSLIYLITTIILARVLTPDDFGVIGILSILFMVADVLVDAGLGGSLIKEKTITDADCHTIFSFCVFVSILLYSVVFFLSPYLEDYYVIEDLAFIAQLISLTFVINSFSLVPQALLMRNLKFRELFIISLVSTLIAAIISVVTGFLGAGVYALVIYRIVLSSFKSLLSVLYSKYRYRFVFSVKSLKSLLPFGLYSSLSSVIDTIYENLLASIFGKTMGAKVSGVFYQAKKTEETITSSLATTIGQVAFPILTPLKNNKSDFSKETRSIMSSICGILFPLVLLMSVYSKEIIHCLYGRQWDASAPFFRLLLYAGCLMIMENLNRSFIKALGNGKLLFGTSIIKRSLGITILLAVVFFDGHFLVEAYILCSLLGYLVNQVAVTSYLKTSFIEDLWVSIKIIIPSILLLLLYQWIYDNFAYFMVQALSYAILLIVYYMVFLPMLGVRIVRDKVVQLYHQALGSYADKNKD